MGAVSSSGDVESVQEENKKETKLNHELIEDSKKEI